MLVWQKASKAKLEDGKKYWLIRFYDDVRPVKLRVCVDGKLETIIEKRREPEDYICCVDDMKFQE